MQNDKNTPTHQVALGRGIITTATKHRLEWCHMKLCMGRNAKYHYLGVRPRTNKLLSWEMSAYKKWQIR
jgi:hypothetical protein